MKFYGIESKRGYYGEEFRWYSLFNGARGAWTCEKEKVEKRGQDHKKVLMFIHNINQRS